MSSMSSVIKQDNYKLLSTTKNEDRLSNCRNKDKCLQKCIVYEADVITNKDSHIYCGARDGEFKSPHNNYINSFHHRHQVQDMELSNTSGKYKAKTSSSL